MARPRLALPLMLLCPLVTGCDSSDEGRLAEYARQSLDQQARQNDQIARQAQEVTWQTERITDASQKLVAADAAARQELIAAQRTLQQEVQSARSEVDRQRDALELDRRQLAEQAQRDPIVAATIHAVGLTLACLLPLLLGFAVLRLLQTESTDEGIVNELLVADLASDRPQLLVWAGSERSATPRLDCDSDDDPRPYLEGPTDDEPAQF
jgi:multidrug efflux pump subunit AcrA (membrane-fusion protein)